MWRDGATFAALACAVALLATAAAARAQAEASANDSGSAQRDRMATAWASAYSDHGVQVTAPTGAPPPAAPSANVHNLPDYVTLQVGGEYAFNGVDFSGKPTVSFITNDGRPLTVSPQGTSFPQTFEDTDHKLSAYGAVSTTGFGDPRLNTYVSARYRQDLNGLTSGSPFQSSLDAFSGNKADLVNGYAEMTSLAPTGPLSYSSARIGRVFIPFSFPGLLGSPAIDGGRFAYDDTRTTASVFAGRWQPFWGDVTSNVFVGGGSISRQLLPAAGPNVGLTPYVEYLHFNDSEGGTTSNRHIYGFRGWYHAMSVDGYFTWINQNPVDLGLQATYVPGKLSIYGSVLKKLTSDDYTFDVFLTADDLRNRQFLNLGTVNKYTDLQLDASYQALRWLNLGVGTWVRALDDEQDQGPYSESFQEGNGRVLISPPGPFSGSVQYRYRGVRRAIPTTTLFNDVSHAGETQYQEVNGEVGYRFKDLLRAYVGGYLGVYNLQDRLRRVKDTTAAGGYLRTRTNLTNHLAWRFLVLLDRGNDEFTPDINFQYSVRTALDFYY